MCSRTEAAEQARSTLQVGLAEAERSREALWEKNTHLEVQLQKAEETSAELQADLRGIQEEKEEIQEKLSEVRKQNCCFTLGMILAHWEKLKHYRNDSESEEFLIPRND